MPRKDRPHTLDDSTRRKALKQLMQARVNKDRTATIQAKILLGEAGPVWWDDDQPDFSGKQPSDTPYAAWWDSLTDKQRLSGR